MTLNTFIQWLNSTVTLDRRPKVVSLPPEDFDLLADVMIRYGSRDPFLRADQSLMEKGIDNFYCRGVLMVVGEESQTVPEVVEWRERKLHVF